MTEGPHVIQWIEDGEIEIVTSYCEETEKVDKYFQPVNAGEIDDVDIILDNGNTVDMQFGDGSMSFGVSANMFEEYGE